MIYRFGIFDNTRGAWVEEHRVYAMTKEEYDADGSSEPMMFKSRADAEEIADYLAELTDHRFIVRTVAI